MSDRADSLPDFSDQGSTSESSCASETGSCDFSQSSHSRQLGGQITPAFDVVLPLYAARLAIHVSDTASTNSTGSEWLSYPASTESISGFTPSVSASRDAGDLDSSASTCPSDPILQHFALNALHTPPTSSAASHNGLTTGLNTLSFDESTGSEEADSSGAESDPEKSDPSVETPATSYGSQEADHIFALDQNDEDQGAVIPILLALSGLELPYEYRIEPLFSDTNNNNLDDTFSDTLEFLENKRADLRGQLKKASQDAPLHTPDDSILAPSPGLAYNEYYSSTRTHSQRHARNIQKKRRARRGAQSTSSGSSCGTGTSESHQDISRYIRAQCSQLSPVYRSVDGVQLSPEMLSSILFPSFALSHLFRSSLDTLATELIARDSLAYGSDYTIELFLGFGPPISHQVTTFTPRDKTALRSYQKLPDDDQLYIEESLPIVVYLFSVENHAEEIDSWLDQIIDSESELQEYVELMERRHKGDLSVHVLRCIITWYSTSEDKLSQPAHRILRAALKLLMTTTLLSLVPRVESIPESLYQYLSPQPSTIDNIHLSTIAPKLLTRQIKARIHHLQRELLHNLFCYFFCPLRLAAEVKVVVGLLVAFVLELFQNAGRQFAKFASRINSKLVVKQQDVTQYETDMQAQVFDRLRSSAFDVAGKTGQLGEMLRNMGSIVKGKGKDEEDQESQFVFDILDVVL